MIRRYPLGGAILLLLAASGSSGFWVGESGSPHLAKLSAILMAVAVPTITFATIRKIWAGSAALVAALLLYTLAFILGWRSFTFAFNECVEQGEIARQSLDYFEATTGHYPGELAQLEDFSLCKRILHPTILEYSTTETGYVLSFRDWQMVHIATESEPFSAHK